MRVLVAGGAGFIGSHLCDALLACGDEVVCADRLVFGTTANVDHLMNCERFEFVRADLSELEPTVSLLKDGKFDVVYHLAANSDIQKGGQEPSIDFQDTLMTTRCILEGMRVADCRKLFFSSTSAVYGEKCDELLTEETGGIKPASYYGGAKLASEALIDSYASMLDMSVLVFRFPNVIGPRLTHGVIFDFVRKLRETPDELEILGDGTQCKPYIYVLDLVEAIIRLTESWHPGVDVFNVGVIGGGTTVTRVAEVVREEMGLPDARFCFTGGDRGWKGDVPRFDYDISKVLATGWAPTHTSDEAVRATVRAVLGS